MPYCVGLRALLCRPACPAGAYPHLCESWVHIVSDLYRERRIIVFVDNIKLQTVICFVAFAFHLLLPLPVNNES